LGLKVLPHLRAGPEVPREPQRHFCCHPTSTRDDLSDRRSGHPELLGHARVASPKLLLIEIVASPEMLPVKSRATCDDVGLTILGAITARKMTHRPAPEFNKEAAEAA